MFRSWKEHGTRKLDATSRRRLVRGARAASRRALLARHGPRRLASEIVTTSAAPDDSRSFPITISADAGVGSDARTRATELLVGAARFAPRAVIDGRVRIRVHDDPAFERPVDVGASLDVGGRVVRAHAEAARLADAFDLLDARLRRNLERVDKRRRARRRAR